MIRGLYEHKGMENSLIWNKASHGGLGEYEVDFCGLDLWRNCLRCWRNIYSREKWLHGWSSKPFHDQWLAPFGFFCMWSWLEFATIKLVLFNNCDHKSTTLPISSSAYKEHIFTQSWPTLFSSLQSPHPYNNPLASSSLMMKCSLSLYILPPRSLYLSVCLSTDSPNRLSSEREILQLVQAEDTLKNYKLKQSVLWIISLTLF